MDVIKGLRSPGELGGWQVSGKGGSPQRGLPSKH